MADDDTTPPAGDPAGDPAGGNAQGGTDNPAGNGTGGTPPDDPAALRAEIERLRRENGAARVNAKTAAAEAARQEFAQQIGKILGLVPDETPVDAAKLADQLTAAQQAGRQTALELAVFKAADAAGANPTALLDSRSFLATVAGTEPTDTAAITQAITQAVAANPAFGRAVAGTPTMRPNPSQGSSANPPVPLADQAQAALSAGNVRESLRIKARLVSTDQP
jgi:hypothetical protein